MQDDFAVKDLGTLSYFLGIEVNKVQDGIVLTQQKYIRDLFANTNMAKSKGAVTPMLATDKLSRHDGVRLSAEDTTKYHSVVGALQYLLLTKPDIAFSVNKVCQFLAPPTEDHWVAVKRILLISKTHQRWGS